MSTLQNLKDTFYLAVRDRLAALNPDRTVVLRGVTRTAVVVAENELPADAAAADDPLSAELLSCFVLHWTDVAETTEEAMPLLHARCVVRYRSAGSSEIAGMDRGRTLAAMDAELRQMLVAPIAPQRSFDGAVPSTLGSRVFWSPAIFAPVTVSGDRMERAATVEVFAWEEPA